MGRLFLSVAFLLLSRTAVAATAQECADMEASGRIDVTCFGADPQEGGNDTDGVWRAMCHVWRGHPEITAKTLYFPAGEYRVNMVIGWDGSLAGAPTSFTVQGDGRDDSVLVKDPAVAIHTGTWTGSVHSLDPICAGAWLQDWDLNSAAQPNRDRMFFFVGENNTSPSSLHLRDLTVTRATRVYPYTDPQADQAIAFGSSGAVSMERVKMSNFYAGARLDWGPRGTFTTSQPRPQTFTATDSVFEDMIRPINGDGWYTVRASAFRRIGTADRNLLGYAVYVKRVHQVVIEDSTFADSSGYALVLDNDHDTGVEPAFSQPGSRVSFQRNAVTGHTGAYDILLHTVNNRIAWTVKGNTFTGEGYLKFYGRADVTFQDNTLDGIGLFFNASPVPGTVMRPAVLGNRFAHSYIYARTEGLTLSGNSLTTTGTDTVTVEPTARTGNINAGGTALVPGATVTLRWTGTEFVAP